MVIVPLSFDVMKFRKEHIIYLPTRLLFLDYL